MATKQTGNTRPDAVIVKPVSIIPLNYTLLLYVALMAKIEMYPLKYLA